MLRSIGLRPWVTNTQFDTDLAQTATQIFSPGNTLVTPISDDDRIAAPLAFHALSEYFGGRFDFHHRTFERLFAPRDRSASARADADVGPRPPREVAQDAPKTPGR